MCSPLVAPVAGTVMMMMMMMMMMIL